jgi:hypothetical protein
VGIIALKSKCRQPMIREAGQRVVGNFRLHVKNIRAGSRMEIHECHGFTPGRLAICKNKSRTSRVSGCEKSCQLRFKSTTQI